MTAPFAALESRLNASILAHMPNAVATHATLGTANVVFTSDSQAVDHTGMVIAGPSLLASVDDWPTPAEGDEVIVNGTDYVLRTPESAHNSAFWRIPLGAA